MFMTALLLCSVQVSGSRKRGSPAGQQCVGGQTKFLKFAALSSTTNIYSREKEEANLEQGRG